MVCLVFKFLSYPYLYWSPKACLPMMMGLFQPGTSLGTMLVTMGSRKTVPPRWFLHTPSKKRKMNAKKKEKKKEKRKEKKRKKKAQDVLFQSLSSGT